MPCSICHQRSPTCNRCRATQKRFRDSHPEKAIKDNARISGRLMRYKDKFILLPRNPKIGICSQCHKSVADGEIKRTQMHHFKYDDSDPLAHTVELCVNCHNETDKPRNSGGQYSSA